MKKLLGILGLMAIMLNFSFAGDYDLNESAVQEKFQKAESVSFSSVDSDALKMNNLAVPSGGGSVGGFVVRWAIFGALIWSHRKYMGTGGESVWYYYCIPVYGTVITCGEFIDVVFFGNLNDYSNNGDACVWCN